MMIFKKTLQNLNRLTYFVTLIDLSHMRSKVLSCNLWPPKIMAPTKAPQAGNNNNFEL